MSKLLVELEIGIAEHRSANWSSHRDGDCYAGHSDIIEFLPCNGDIFQFKSWDEFDKMFPKTKAYHIGHTYHQQFGRNGHRCEISNTYKIVRIL